MKGRQETEKKKDRSATEARILQAFRALIEERGFADSGVNAVAEKAGVNKVLIYRYFGGMEGLCAALAKDIDLSALGYAESLVREVEPGTELKPQLIAALRGIRGRLVSDDFSLALMTEELREENELTRLMAAARERAGTSLGAAIEGRIAAARAPGSKKDVQASLAIVSAALFYLTLRERGVRMYNGVDIRSEEGWDRLYEAMADAILG